MSQMTLFINTLSKAACLEMNSPLSYLVFADPDKSIVVLGHLYTGLCLSIIKIMLTK